MSEIDPVGWAHKHDLEGMADGDSFAVIEPTSMDDLLAVPLYTAGQIREAVERVRATVRVHSLPNHADEVDAYLDALLRELGMEDG